MGHPEARATCESPSLAPRVPSRTRCRICASPSAGSFEGALLPQAASSANASARFRAMVVPMHPEAYHQFGERLLRNLSGDAGVLGLVALGSMSGEPPVADRWSD